MYQNHIPVGVVGSFAELDNELGEYSDSTPITTRTFSSPNNPQSTHNSQFRGEMAPAVAARGRFAGGAGGQPQLTKPHQQIIHPNQRKQGDSTVYPVSQLGQLKGHNQQQQGYIHHPNNQQHQGYHNNQPHQQQLENLPQRFESLQSLETIHWNNNGSFASSCPSDQSNDRQQREVLISPKEVDRKIDQQLQQQLQQHHVSNYHQNQLSNHQKNPYNTNDPGELDDNNHTHNNNRTRNNNNPASRRPSFTINVNGDDADVDDDDEEVLINVNRAAQYYLQSTPGITSISSTSLSSRSSGGFINKEGQNGFQVAQNGHNMDVNESIEVENPHTRALEEVHHGIIDRSPPLSPYRYRNPQQQQQHHQGIIGNVIANSGRKASDIINIVRKNLRGLKENFIVRERGERNGVKNGQKLSCPEISTYEFNHEHNDSSNNAHPLVHNNNNLGAFFEFDDIEGDNHDSGHQIVYTGTKNEHNDSKKHKKLQFHKKNVDQEAQDKPSGEESGKKQCCNCILITLFKKYGWDCIRIYFGLSLLFSIVIGSILYITHSTYYCIALLSCLPFGLGDYIAKKFSNSTPNGQDHTNSAQIGPDYHSYSQGAPGNDGTAINTVNSNNSNNNNNNEFLLLLGCISIINNILEPLRIIILLYCLKLLGLEYRYCFKQHPFLAYLQYFLYLINFRSTNDFMSLPLIPSNYADNELIGTNLSPNSAKVVGNNQQILKMGGNHLNNHNNHNNTNNISTNIYNSSVNYKNEQSNNSKVIDKSNTNPFTPSPHTTMLLTTSANPFNQSMKSNIQNTPPLVKEQQIIANADMFDNVYNQ